MSHVMVDLETWGVLPGCAPRSVGACVFNPLNGDIGPTFYANITDASCEAAGLKQEAGTKKFWAEQGDAARDALDTDQVSLGTALMGFTAWWAKVEGKQLWAMGANFDPPILEAAYEAMMLSIPWEFWNVRCCRTVLAMADRKPYRAKGSTKHHALDDAIAQAVALAASFRAGSLRPA